MTLHVVKTYDSEALRQTICDAKQLAGARPTDRELSELSALLIRDLKSLLAAAEPIAQELTRSSPEWYRLASLIASGRSAITSPDAGRLGRIVRVQMLARAALLLLNEIEGRNG